MNQSGAVRSAQCTCTDLPQKPPHINMETNKNTICRGNFDPVELGQGGICPREPGSHLSGLRPGGNRFEAGLPGSGLSLFNAFQ